MSVGKSGVGSETTRDGSVNPAAIHNIYHCTANNVGDLMCGPGQYLWPELHIPIPVKPPRKHIERAVVGGGQIFGQLLDVLSSIKDFNPGAKAVAWGVGLPPKGKQDKTVKTVAQYFDLFGTRNYDWRDQLNFVPCASCLMSAFDTPPRPEHEVVFFLHQNKGDPVDVPAGAPVRFNTAASGSEIIDFLASGETVVTSSYHGVYWAQLLGRRVICVPYNDKFTVLQHNPTTALASEWSRAVATARRAPELLEEYRSINVQFGKRVLDLFHG